MLGRAPVCGQAKTRLIPALGAKGAAAAQAALLTHVVSIARDWCEEEEQRRFRLWCSPDNRHPFFSQLAPDHQTRNQFDGDLGQRLLQIVQSELTSVEGVILLGGDGVSVSRQLLSQVESALLEVPVVMAPAEDGGYILLALKQLSADLFSGISWGSDQVVAESRQRLKKLGWQWREFPGQWDVDRPVDWQRFQEQMACHQ